MNILEKIVEQKRAEMNGLEQADSAQSEAVLKRLVEERGDRRDFASALKQPRRGSVALIAEVKKASPSAGLIRPDFDPVRIAVEYETGGASCLSVLTDEKFFQGSLDYLRRIRQAVSLPLLRKDFIIDERQLAQSVEAGADAILLIVAILSDAQLKRMHDLITGAGLAALVEVHDARELERALDAGATLIGVNNRDLRSFKVDLATTERVAERLREQARDREVLLVAESGLHTASDVRRVAQAGARAILVGESLMRHSDLGQKIAELLDLQMG